MIVAILLNHALEGLGVAFLIEKTFKACRWYYRRNHPKS